METESRDQKLDELAHQFSEQVRRGLQPTVDRFAQDHPEFAAEIRDLFPGLLLIERMEAEASQGEGGDLVEVPARLGEYRILRRIGCGGMGAVYEAVQEPLGRHVALKLFPFHGPRDARLLERFKREAQAASQLHHTNIVPVFTVGEDAGFHYYTMQLIQGRPLDQILAETRAASPQQVGGDPVLREILTHLSYDSPDFYRQAARIGLQAAEALAYAHAGGVLHRDVKPGNVLLDVHGNTWISDFGVARLEGLDDLTMADEVLGTLAYVPPERFRGCTDARGDVYCLGLTLHEILTRTKAFHGATRAELVHQILHAAPLRLRTIDRRIPRDLETIVQKAIAREPQHRYQTAADLAEDLRRFRADRPILARRLSVAEQALRWCRRNPLPAAACSVATLLLLSVAIISTWAYFRENSLRESLDMALRRVGNAEIQARSELFASYVAGADAARLSRRQGQRFDSLTAIGKAARLLPMLGLPAEAQQKQQEELRDLAITCLALPDIRELGDRPARGAILDSFRLNRCAERDVEGALVVRCWPEGPELARLSNVNEHTWFGFTPERAALVLVEQKSHALLRWPLQDASPSLVANLGEHDGTLWSCTFSSGGRRVLLVHRIGSRGLTEVLDWPSGTLRLSRELPFQGDCVSAAKLSSDGRHLAVIEGSYGSDGSKVVSVTDVETGKQLARLEHSASAESMAWHPDSETLAVGITDSNDIVLWNVLRKRRIGLLTQQRGGGPRVSIDNTGELLISTSSWGNMLDFWHPYSQKRAFHMPNSLVFEWQKLDGGLVGEARLPDGRWRYAVAEPSPVVRTLVRNPVYGEVEAWRDVSVHRDGRLLAVGSDSGVSLFDLATGLDVGYLPVGYALHPWFVPETGDLLTYSEQGLFRWPVRLSETETTRATIGPPERLPCPAAFGTQIATDRSGRIVAVAASKSAFILHDFGKRVVTLGPFPDCRTVAVSPNGRWVVTGHHGGGPIDVWNAGNGSSVLRLADDRPPSTFCFSPNSQLFSLSGDSPCLLQTADWRAHPLSDTSHSGYCAFSPDGRLAINLSPAGATLRESATGGKLITLQLPESPTVWHATFTPDGVCVILNSNDQRATYVWDLARVSRELSRLGLGKELSRILPARSTCPPLMTPLFHLEIELGGLEHRG